MTDFDMRYLRDPRIQRKIRKIQSLGPNYAGLVRSLLNEEAGRHFDRMIRLAELGERKTAGQERIRLGEKGLETRAGIKKADIASREKISEADLASRRRLRLADIASREDIQAGRFGLERESFETEKKRFPWEVGIAAANIPLQFALGERERREKKKLRKAIELSFLPYGKVSGALHYLD